MLLAIQNFFSESISSHFGVLLAAFISLISVANPFSGMPVFTSITEGRSKQERTKIARKTATYMLIILTLFLIAGSSIIEFFGISIPGIRVAGGLIILQSGWLMLSPKKEDKITEEGKASAKEKDDPSFSPLALPLMAGPGSISVVLGLTSQVTSIFDYVIIFLAILSVVIVSYFVLRAGPIASKYISKNGMDAFTRLMGFIVMAIAVQFLLSGIKEFFFT